MNQKTSRRLKTIGIVLVAGSLWPATRVVLAALKPPVAITLTPLAAIDKDNDHNYKDRDKDKGVYKNTDVDKDESETPTISTDVIVNFVTAAETPLNPGFNGFNSNLQNAVEYYDPNFQQILKTLSPGWLRFPGGTDSEAFDWASGEIVTVWLDALAKNPDPYQYGINLAAQPIVGGKGGSSFSDFAALATNLGGAKIIVSVNAFTDTPQSAQAFAQYALTNHIPVAAWELANEPYTWTKSGLFFTDAADYATKMKPYRDAIKAADPNAVVALYFSEAGHPDPTWDNALESYSPQYWDAVTYHEYVYPGNLTTFNDLMAAANGNLFSNTTSHVTDYLMPRNKSGVTYLISEVSPSDGHGGPKDVTDGPLLGTLYGGIYSAEFALRMSTLPQVKYVASFQVLSNAGIDETNPHLNVVQAAYNSGTTINTSGLNFGFFLSAQAAGEAVANGALHNSIGVYATTTTGGPTVPTDTGGSIPAVYAQAYEGGNGKRYVVLTNKGASTAVAQITQDGVVPTNQMDMTFVTGTEPSLVNTNPPPNNVQIQTQTVTTPGAVTIPPYSVVRLEWSVTSVQFSMASYFVGEGGGSAVITVTRTGVTTGTATVDFATSDGTASQRTKYITASGTLTFNPGDTAKTFTVLVIDEGYVEGDKTVNLALSNATGATLTTPSTAVLTIFDNDSPGLIFPAQKRFGAALTGGQETPPTGSGATGQGYVLLNPSETTGQAGLVFTGLGSPETVAHIHGPGAIGVAAPVIFPLPATNPVTNFAFSPTAAQVSDLKAALQYMNVHSNIFPNGETRGQLLWNPTLEENFFVRQHYLDFLGREPDTAGFNFWTSTISACAADAVCLHNNTISTSDAYFFSDEFHQTAGFVFLIYRAAYGNTQPFPNPDNSNPTEANKLPNYDNFVADRSRVVGGANLTASQQAFTSLLVTRPEFVARYPVSLSTGAQFVSAVLTNIQNSDGVTFAGADQTMLINQYNNAGGGNAGRGMVLYSLTLDDAVNNPINNRAFVNAEYNRQFALTLYFGYLRRNPDIAGFLFWQGQINSAAVGNVPKQQSLVCSYITSTEYQLRFGPNAPRSNQECPP